MVNFYRANFSKFEDKNQVIKVPTQLVCNYNQERAHAHAHSYTLLHTLTQIWGTEDGALSLDLTRGLHQWVKIKFHSFNYKFVAS